MTLAVAMIGSLHGYALDFTVGQLNYTVLSEEEGTVEVASTTQEYDSEITVPATVDNDGKTYTVVGLGYFAFNNRKELTTVNLPATIETIGIRGTHSFHYCSALVNINVDEANPTFASVDGVVYDKDITRLVICPGGKTSVTVPSTVEIIGASSFRTCTVLESVELPSSLTTIEIAAFINCEALPEIDLPESVKEIGEDSFRNCYSLATFTIPNSVSAIQPLTFYGCRSLVSVLIPESVTEIMNSSFTHCTSLASLTIPSSVTKIMNGVFMDCPALKSIEMLGEIPVKCNPYFGEDNYANATLYVPVGTKAAYEAVEPWKNFVHIEERDFSGAEGIETGVDAQICVVVNNGTVTVCGLEAGEPIEVYDMAGRKIYSGTEHTVAGLAKGTYVVKSAHRTSKFAL